MELRDIEEKGINNTGNNLRLKISKKEKNEQ